MSEARSSTPVLHDNIPADRRCDAVYIAKIGDPKAGKS
jgi:hypothetical protein